MTDIFDRVRKNVLNKIRTDKRKFKEMDGEIPSCCYGNCKERMVVKKSVVINGEEKLVPLCAAHK